MVLFHEFVCLASLLNKIITHKDKANVPFIHFNFYISIFVFLLPTQQTSKYKAFHECSLNK